MKSSCECLKRYVHEKMSMILLPDKEVIGNSLQTSLPSHLVTPVTSCHISQAAFREINITKSHFTTNSPKSHQPPFNMPTIISYSRSQVAQITLSNEEQDALDGIILLEGCLEETLQVNSNGLTESFSRTFASRQYK